MKRDQILAALPALSPTDLRAINAATGVLMGGGHPDSPQTLNGPLGWLYEALQGITNQRLPLKPGTPTGRAFKANAPIAIAFMTEAFGAKVMANKTSALAIIRLLLTYIEDDLKDKKVPVSMGSMVRNLARVAQVFETAFPDYLKNGIASLVLKSIKGKRK